MQKPRMGKLFPLLPPCNWPGGVTGAPGWLGRRSIPEDWESNKQIFHGPRDPRWERAEVNEGPGAAGSVWMSLLGEASPCPWSSWSAWAPCHHLLSKHFVSEELFPKTCPSVLPDLQQLLSTCQLLPVHLLPNAGEASCPLPVSAQLLELFFPLAAACPE